MLLCDSDGRPLIWHHSRSAGEVGSLRVKAFCSERLRYITPDEPPIQFFAGSTFLLRRLHGGAHLVGATSANINAALAMAVLVGLETALLDLGVIASEVLRSWDLLPRAHLFHAIMEEALDNGVPQTLDVRQLSKLVLVDTSGGPLLEGQPADVMPRQPATDAKVLIDMVERVSVQLDCAGRTISAEVHGSAQLQCLLGGDAQPKCVLVLNDAAQGQTMQFHESVRLGVAGPGEAVFTPPGGVAPFTLLSWHRVGHVTPPLKISCSRIDLGRTRMELIIQLRAQLPSTDLTVYDIRANVPLPSLTSSIRALTGGAPKSTAKWVRGENSVRWKIRALQADGEASLAIEVAMAPRTHDTAPGEAHHLAPIVVKAFSVPGHTATGLRVRALRVLGHDAVAKLVRYTVCAGDYEVRMPT